MAHLHPCGRIDGRALARGAVAPSHYSHCTALGVNSLQQGCPLLCLDSLKKRDTNTILADPSLHCTALRHAEHSPTVTRPATLLLPPPQLPTTSILTPVFRLYDTDDTHTQRHAERQRRSPAGACAPRQGCRPRRMAGAGQAVQVSARGRHEAAV